MEKKGKTNTFYWLFDCSISQPNNGSFHHRLACASVARQFLILLVYANTCNFFFRTTVRRGSADSFCALYYNHWSQNMITISFCGKLNLVTHIHTLQLSIWSQVLCVRAMRTDTRLYNDFDLLKICQLVYPTMPPQNSRGILLLPLLAQCIIRTIAKTYASDSGTLSIRILWNMLNDIMEYKLQFSADTGSLAASIRTCRQLCCSSVKQRFIFGSHSSWPSTIYSNRQHTLGLQILSSHTRKSPVNTCNRCRPSIDVFARYWTFLLMILLHNALYGLAASTHT